MEQFDRLLEPIGDTIPKIKIDPKAPQQDVWCLRGVWSHGDGIFTREGVAGLENFPAGKTTHWVFWFDEVQYVLEGKAEVTYTLASTRFTEEKKMTIEKGDVYIIPRGTDISWKVDPSGPLVRFCVIMPGPERYLPGSLKRPDGSIIR